MAASEQPGSGLGLLPSSAATRLTRRIGSLVGRSGRLLQQLLSRVLLLCVVRIVVVTTKASHCW